MKIKATLLAMNKSLFFGIGFITFTSLVLLINWLLSLPVKQADTIANHVIRTEQQIQRLRTVQSEIQISFIKNGDLFSSEKARKERDASPIIRNLRKDIEYYKGFPPFLRSQDVTASLNDLSIALKQFESNLEDLILASIERGNEDAGLISRWRGLSSAMMTASSKNSAAVIKKIENIKQQETNYLLRGNPKITDEINGTANEIRTLLNQKEQGINVADLDSYMALTYNVKTLDNRIGSETQGIISNTGKSLDALLISSENANRFMNDILFKVKFRWTILRYLVIALFTIACIILLILITSNGITLPLKSAFQYAQKLTTGDLPEHEVPVEGLPEIRVIDEALNKIVHGLKQKVELMQSLNRKELDLKLELCGPHDILGRELVALQQQMIDASEVQKKNDIENNERRYINEGLAKFGEVLRTRSNDIHELGDTFIRDIVKYMNAIQGGFFMCDENQGDHTTLELISAFAYNRKKYLEKSIPLGEGLVGTCAVEKQIINLTEIPEGYITITSGLGDTKPGNLLLVPVLHENELIGVLEIASLHRYKDYEIQFAGEVAENLGSTIIYARNNMRTAGLLTKSQQQAVEMTEQEEEMRQNMEELKATQEESVRREEEFRGIAEAIASSLFVVEYDQGGNIRNANEKLCIFLGRNLEELIGKTHFEVFKSTVKPDEAFWDELQKNSQMNRVEKIKIGRKEHTLKEHFASLLNHDGHGVQYINFITELSA